jgi:hypothetical protein
MQLRPADAGTEAYSAASGYKTGTGQIANRAGQTGGFCATERRAATERCAGKQRAQERDANWYYAGTRRASKFRSRQGNACFDDG